MAPGRIDLGIGRAPGTDLNTAAALRRGRIGAEEFPDQLMELPAFLDDGFPDGPPFKADAYPVPGPRQDLENGSHRDGRGRGRPLELSSPFLVRLEQLRTQTHHRTVSCLDQAVHEGGLLAAAIRTDEQPEFPDQGNAAHDSFGGSVGQAAGIMRNSLRAKDADP